jgi:hypothetical protein
MNLMILPDKCKLRGSSWIIGLTCAQVQRLGLGILFCLARVGGSVIGRQFSRIDVPLDHAKSAGGTTNNGALIEDRELVHGCWCVTVPAGIVAHGRSAGGALRAYFSRRRHY